MIRDELTPEQAKQIVAEIDAWHSKRPEEWLVVSIEQFYMLSEEVYMVRYRGGFSLMFSRDINGKLSPAGGTTYYAPNFDRPPEKEE